MNTKELRAQAVNAYEAKIEYENNLRSGVIVCSPDRLLSLVIEEDRPKLIPYVEDEILAARKLGRGALTYISELNKLLEIIGEEDAE